MPRLWDVVEKRKEEKERETRRLKKELGIPTEKKRLVEKKITIKKPVGQKPVEKPVEKVKEGLGTPLENKKRLLQDTVEKMKKRRKSQEEMLKKHGF